jgi:hypothetical protein
VDYLTLHSRRTARLIDFGAIGLAAVDDHSKGERLVSWELPLFIPTALRKQAEFIRFILIRDSLGRA